MRELRERIVYEVVRRARRGESARRIAQAVGIDRKTVKVMLEEVEQRRNQGDNRFEREHHGGRTPRRSKLDPFAGDIRDLLDRYGDLRATRLHEELRALGFGGGYTIVREYLKKVRGVPKKKVYQLVETDPGKQAQFDWSPYRLHDGTPIECFSMVLSYSRRLYAEFTTNRRQETIFRQMRLAFEFHGGVPEQCVCDSMPGIVDRWEMDEPVLNLRAVDFAAFYGFTYHIAPRADGAYKGKIERPYRYLEESFFNGRTFYTIEQAQQSLRWWLSDRANVRTHRTTRRVPEEVWAQERGLLQPLPAHRFDDREIQVSIVDSYGYAAFDGNHYRAPDKLGGHPVFMCADDDQVEILDARGHVERTYPRALRNAHQHIPPPTRRKRRRPKRELLGCFERWGAVSVRYAEQVCAERRYGAHELDRILALQKTYALEDIVAAIAHATAYRAFGIAALSRILRARARPLDAQAQLSAKARERTRHAMADAPVRQRELKSYGELLGSARAAPEIHDENDEAVEHGSASPQDSDAATDNDDEGADNDDDEQH